MAKVVLYMSMSVDGFIAGPDDSEEHGLGVGGEVLHGWLADGGVDPASHRPSDEAGATVFDEVLATGAVITGRRTFEFAGGWAGDHHDGVPIFVLTRAVPPEPPPGPRATSPTSRPASPRPRRPRATATSCSTGPRPPRNAYGRGCSTRCSSAWCRCCSGGRRLFADLPHVELELVRVLDGPAVQHLGYRVER